MIFICIRNIYLDSKEFEAITSFILYVIEIYLLNYMHESYDRSRVQ
jgi:hypothetical protein